MLRSVLVLGIFLAVLSVASAKSDGCEIEENLFIPVGQSAPSKKSCHIYTCRAKGEVSGLACPSIVAKPPCRLESQTNYDLYPYPDCCPKAVCPP